MLYTYITKLNIPARKKNLGYKEELLKKRIEIIRKKYNLQNQFHKNIQLYSVCDAHSN